MTEASFSFKQWHHLTVKDFEKSPFSSITFRLPFLSFSFIPSCFLMGQRPTLLHFFTSLILPDYSISRHHSCLFLFICSIFFLPLSYKFCFFPYVVFFFYFSCFLFLFILFIFIALLMRIFFFPEVENKTNELSGFM